MSHPSPRARNRTFAATLLTLLNVLLTIFTVVSSVAVGGWGIYQVTGGTLVLLLAVVAVLTARSAARYPAAPTRRHPTAQAAPGRPRRPVPRPTRPAPRVALDDQAATRDEVGSHT